MRWEVCLTGHQATLEMLSNVVQNEVLTIRYDGGRCYISSALFEDCNSADEVLEKSERFVETLSGFVRLTDGRKHRIAVSTVTEQMQDGTARDNLFFREKLELRSTLAVVVTYKDGSTKTVGPKQLFTDKAALCLSSPSLARALSIYGQGELDWSNLYRVLEIILNNCGGENGLKSEGWAKKGDIDRFRRSANDPSVSGDSARHSVFKFEPPPNPMNIREGRVFIETLLCKWVGSQ